MELIGIEEHRYYGKYPCRLPVWWGYKGESGVHPDVKGVTGRRIILRIEKRFTRIERLMAKILRAPKEVRRPLDMKNSLLWELCNGRNTFEEICDFLNSTFHEDISPVVERSTRGIELLKSQNLVTILDTPFNEKWSIGPGVTPKNQNLKELDDELGIDTGEE